MIFIYNKLMEEFTVGNMFNYMGKFICVKNNLLYHSPDYRTSVASVDEVYGGNPSPANVTVRECWCKVTDVKNGGVYTGKTADCIRLESGQGEFGRIFRLNKIIGDPAVRKHEIDNKTYFREMPENVKKIFRAIKYNEETEAYFFDETAELSEKTRIVNGGKTSGGWTSAVFLYNGLECTFEELLLQNLK